MGALHSQTNNIEPSRVTWKWEYVPNLFTPYPPQVSAFIERHFVADFTGQFQVEIPGSGPHTIDLTKMTHTGFQLERRILRDISQEPSINVLWNWENDLGEMESYTQEDSDKIEAFYQRKDINFTHIWIGGFEYWIDLRNQCQISIRSMRKRRIERNIIPDHKYVWQWQADNGEFVNYIDPISRKIEMDYFLKHDSPLAIPISGTMYFIDTQRMCEINETDGKERQIRRVLENYIRYKWLWKDELDTWHSYSPCLSERFETNYLNPNSGPFVIYINYTEFLIDTRTMMETNTLSGKGYQIKRQALHNDFPVWGWITRNGAFKAFSPSDSKLIEANFILNDPSPLTVKVQDTEYSINVKSRTRINSKNQKQKTIERRLITNNYPPNLDFLPKGECFKIFKFLAQNGYLPPDWDANQKEEVQKFQASDIEWNIFSEKFYKTMNSDEWLLSNLYRFQSVSLINSFMLNKMTLKVCNRSFEEPELLFYVPNKEAGPDMLDSLCENPLTGQFSPLNSFGKGYYFAKTVKGCKDYAWEREDGTKVIMCFWVLPGKTLKVKQEDEVNTLYNGKYKEWSEVKKAPMGADCSRVVVDGEEMLVVYNAERCYPMYILEFNNIN